MLCLATMADATMPQSQAQESESHPDSGSAQAAGSESAQAVPAIGREVPESILAFRTISVFLSQVRPKQEPQPVPEFPKDVDDQLKISDSFAHISVIHRDVVALATKRTFHGHVNILACPSAEQDTNSAAIPREATLSTDDATTPAETDDRSRLVFETHATPEPPQETLQIEKTQVILSRNTREDDYRENPDLRTNSLYPQIVDTTAPEDIEKQRPEDYVCSLLCKW